jgi:hypothetical protein
MASWPVISFKKKVLAAQGHPATAAVESTLSPNTHSAWVYAVYCNLEALDRINSQPKV